MTPLYEFTNAALNEKLKAYHLDHQRRLGLPPPDELGSPPRQAMLDSFAVLIKKYGLTPADLKWKPAIIDKALDHAHAALGDASVLAGRIAMDYGEPGAGLTLLLRERTFGGNKQFIGNPLVADEDGFFKFTAVTKPGATYEIVARGQDGKDTVLGTPFQHVTDKPTEILLVAPTRLSPPASEFERLNSGIASKRVDGVDISLAKEDHENPGSGDLGMLAADTGWDARVLALAAHAKQDAGSSGLTFKASYALARTGLGSKADALAFVSPDTIRAALEQARASRIVDLDDSEIAEVLQRHNDVVRDKLDKLPLNASGVPVGEFISMAAETDTDAAKFREALFDFATRKAEGKTLWQLAAEKKVGPVSIKRLQWEEPLARLTGANAALMKQLIGRLDTGKELSQLVTEKGLTTAEAWTRHLRDLSGGSPEFLDRMVPEVGVGVGIDGRLEAYSDFLASQVRRNFPTESLLHRVGAMDPGALGITKTDRDAIVTALTRDAGLRIGARGISPIAKTLEAKPRAVVERLHRLYQVTPDDDTFDLVWQEPAFRSAFDIAHLQREEWLEYFRRKLKDRFPPLESRIETVYTKSRQVTEITQNLYGMIPTVLETPPTTVLRRAAPRTPEEMAALKQRFPTLGGMVGELPACEHCRSVLSPAAYFVDLLRLLDRSDADWSAFKSDYVHRHNVDYPHGRPFDELDRRRPDLADLALTCANTHTALPYIDIVNELLENIVAPQPGPAGAVSEDETYSTDELVAEPRRSRAGAYEKLAGLCHPAALPLDLPWEQARSLAPVLGLQPGELGDMLQAGTPERAAADRLGLSPAESALYVDPAQLDNWYKWYGLDTDDAAPLANASMLARRLGLTPLQLTELRLAEFVNPQLQSLVVLHKLGLSLEDVMRDKHGAPPLSSAEQAGYDARLAALDERFAGIGFDSRAEIDKLWNSGKLAKALVLAETVPGGPFDTLVLRCADGSMPERRIWLRLVQFVRLMRRFDWSIERTDSLLCALHPGGAALGTDADWAPRARALLVQLDRMQQLKSLLKSSDEEFFLPALWADLPISGTAPLYDVLFLRDAARAAFDHPAGAYLSAPGSVVRDHLPTLAAALNMDEGAIRLVLPTDDAPLTLAAVSSLYRHARLAKAMGMQIEGMLEWEGVLSIDPCAPPDTTPASALQASARTLLFVGAVRRFRDRQVSAARLGSWMHGSFTPSGQAQPSSILETLHAEFAASAYPQYPVAARIEAILGTEGGAWQGLVTKALVDQIRIDLGTPSIDWAKGPAFVSEPMLRRLAAAVDVARAFQFDAEDMGTLMAARGMFGPDAAGEILGAGAGAGGVPDSPAAWLELLEFADERQLSAPRTPALRALVAAATEARNKTAPQALEEVSPALAELAECSVDEAKAAAGVLWPGGVQPGDLTTWRGLHRIVKLLRLARRTRQAVPALAGWTALFDASGSFTERLAVAGRMRDAARARYTARSWLTAVRPGADGLRQRRRDALLACVIREQGLTGDEEVYERYLIDTRMEPAVLTSRLRVAIAAVQLFVQRCLLGQEGRVTPSAIRGAEWEWMKRYRVWEANRKIFLYPENWLDPEFRDDRSPLFKRLEKRLLQTDINNDEAEDALFEYTRDLEAIANLDIVATTCEQPPGDPGGNTLHVVGRTHAAPHKYFHRRNNRGWTPWEELDADIQGDHVVAAFWKQRLQVFWLVFTDSAAQAQPVGPFSAGSPVPLPVETRTREVRLAWADCIRGEWHTHIGGGRPMLFAQVVTAGGAAMSPQEQVCVRLVIEHDDQGNDGALLVCVDTIDDKHQAFRVISHNAPVTVEPAAPPKEDDRPAALKDLLPAVNRYRVGENGLFTSFWSHITKKVERDGVQGGEIEEIKKGPGRLVDVPPGGMTVTLMDAPLRINDDEWKKRLSPFFFSDLSGSYYVEPNRKSRVETVSEEWWGTDWTKYFIDDRLPVVRPIFPRPVGPEPRPFPWEDGTPIRPGIGETPRADWLLDPKTVVRYDDVLIGSSGFTSAPR